MSVCFIIVITVTLQGIWGPVPCVSVLIGDHFLLITELRSRVVNTPASYSGGSGFKSPRLVIVTEGFSQFPNANAGIVGLP
jgi:hypothetical protein